MRTDWYNSVFEIDLDVIRDAVRATRDFVGPETGIIPVLKANAYGMGTAVMGRFMEDQGFDLLAVAHLNEAHQLRRAGVRTGILLLSPLPAGAEEAALELDLQPAVFRPETVRALSEAAKKYGRPAKVQIKIETGMNRTGVEPGKPLSDLLEVIASCGNLEITGVFTHFATASDAGDPHTVAQFERFKSALAQLAQAGVRPKYIHCCNSAATLWFRDAHCTHVRPGSMLLGFPDMNGWEDVIDIREPGTWKTAVTNVRGLRPGDAAGYDRAFAPESPARVAVIGVGYHDGICRQLALDGGPVLLNGVRTLFVGICLDQALIDATGIDCKVGDEVVLFGRAQNGAALSPRALRPWTRGSAVYQMQLLTERVKRVYLEQGRPSEKYREEP